MPGLVPLPFERPVVVDHVGQRAAEAELQRLLQEAGPVIDAVMRAEKRVLALDPHRSPRPFSAACVLAQRIGHGHV